MAVAVAVAAPAVWFALAWLELAEPPQPATAVAPSRASAVEASAAAGYGGGAQQGQCGGGQRGSLPVTFGHG